MTEQLLGMRQFVIGVPKAEETFKIGGRVVHADRAKFPPFSEALFTRLVSLERKRAERSRKPFALMLIDVRTLLETNNGDGTVERLAVALSSATRETDIVGWYKELSTIGIILTEIGSVERDILRSTMRAKITSALAAQFDPADMAMIRISIHLFPDHVDVGSGGSPEERLHMYPDLHDETAKTRAARLVKRAIDVCGSLAALVLLSPVFLAIALAIKMTSQGPIFFRQTRVGQYGIPFTFLKFRSMYTQSDPRIHQEYIKRFVQNREDCRQGNSNGTQYKLTNDPRITPLGKFLRKSSLDELPQFINVLRGEMSLVGPRPPIPYEIEVYDVWHRRRFFEIKPGITGLWQVKGRSRVTFDEMVRMDIQYAREWSLSLDIKILLATPRAVMFGSGAV